MEAVKKLGFDRFKGMKWNQAKEHLQSCAHLLVLDDTKDERCVEVATTYRDYGIDAGMAALAAHMYMKEYGAGNTAVRAMEIYGDVANKAEAKGLVPERVKTLRHKLYNLEYLVWFAAHGSPNPRQWPLQPPWKKIEQLGGLANIMMFVAMRELGKDETTCSQIAAGAIARFFQEGLEAKKSRRAA